MESYVVEGNVNNLKNNINGILLGAGVASKMNVKQGDNISITSSIGMTKVMKVIGVFQTNNSVVDKTTAYINIAFALLINLEKKLKNSTVFVAYTRKSKKIPIMKPAFF